MSRCGNWCPNNCNTQLNQKQLNLRVVDHQLQYRSDARRGAVGDENAFYVGSLLQTIPARDVFHDLLPEDRVALVVFLSLK